MMACLNRICPPSPSCANCASCCARSARTDPRRVHLAELGLRIGERFLYSAGPPIATWWRNSSQSHGAP